MNSMNSTTYLNDKLNAPIREMMPKDDDVLVLRKHNK